MDRQIQCSACNAVIPVPDRIKSATLSCPQCNAPFANPHLVPAESVVENGCLVMLWLIGVIGAFGAFLTVLALALFGAHIVGLENLLIFGLPQLVIFLIWLVCLRRRRKPSESASTGGVQRSAGIRATSNVGDIALIVFAVLAVWLIGSLTWSILPWFRRR